MSGGVDSSVSAALLKEQGFDVTGVFIKTWHPSFLTCTWIEDRRDAMRVASRLGIPFRTLDLEKEYKQEVVDYMVREYESGRTPNPDVMCNKTIKFGAFLDLAKKEGADLIATGHYARNINSDKTGKQELLAGKDPEKDQSYFLWTLTQSELDHVMFPVGDMRKSDVRTYAAKLSLSVADKKDSQGLCFVGKVDMKKFLQRFLKTEKGVVRNEEGDIVGEHEGAALYTIGQRQGFTVTERTTERKPYYVVAKDMKTNTLIVSHHPKVSKRSPKEVFLEATSFVSGEAPKEGTYGARIRYRQKMQKVDLSYERERLKVSFEERQEGLSPGQSLVLYDGDVCLGGGIMSAQ